jgi:OPT oligopeptide transporter protein
VRKFFIIYVARELNLIFPTPTATAMTIRSMHDAVTGEAVGKSKLRGLMWAFGGAFIQRIVSQYAPGILWEWHPFTWFYVWGHYSSKCFDGVYHRTMLTKAFRSCLECRELGMGKFAHNTANIVLG